MLAPLLCDPASMLSFISNMGLTFNLQSLADELLFTTCQRAPCKMKMCCFLQNGDYNRAVSDIEEEVLDFPVGPQLRLGPQPTAHQVCSKLQSFPLLLTR